MAIRRPALPLRRLHGAPQTDQRYWHHRRDRQRRVGTEDQPSKPTTQRGTAGLERERDFGGETGLLIGRVAGRSQALPSPTGPGPDVGSVLEGGQGPAPPGELSGDRGVGDRGLLGPCVEGLPAGVEPLVALVSA